MWLSAVITPHVPYLRRFARSLTGTQSAGDACVAATLEAIIANPALFAPGADPKVALYRLFLRILRRGRPTGGKEASDKPPAGDDDALFRRISAIPEQARVAFLLSAMEEFTVAEIAQTIGCPEAQAQALIDQAGRDLAAQLCANILIIEDEPLVALDLQRMLQELGHSVVAMARTRDEAVRAALELRPGLILSDIRLADGSSGLDAVNEILPSLKAPVIFVTAFPENLLTGSMPEPAFLIKKPFTRDSLKAAVSQALLFHRKRRARKPETASPQARNPSAPGTAPPQDAVPSSSGDPP